jgi:hypothetical protein
VVIDAAVAFVGGVNTINGMVIVNAAIAFGGVHNVHGVIVRRGRVRLIRWGRWDRRGRRRDILWCL